MGIDMTQNIFLECIPITDAANKYKIKRETIRKWINDEDVSGIKIKPFQVHEPSLVEFLKLRSNQSLKKLYSETEPVSGPAKKAR